MINTAIRICLVGLGLATLGASAGCQGPEQSADPAAATASYTAEEGESTGTLYGRVTTTGGGVYEGPLRWGGGEDDRPPFFVPAGVTVPTPVHGIKEAA